MCNSKWMQEVSLLNKFNKDYDELKEKAILGEHVQNEWKIFLLKAKIIEIIIVF